MTKYLIRRVLASFLVILGVATLVFFMLRAVPGDPFAAILAEVDPSAAEELRAKMGLDRPVAVQYVLWIGRLLQGDMGTSLYGSHVSVTRIIREAIPRTLSLAALSAIVAIAIALPAGIISALRKNTWMDYLFTFFAFLGLSMPSFWLAILLIIVFSVNLGWLPAIGYKPLWTMTDTGLEITFWPWLRNLNLPSVAIGTAFSAIIARMTRSAMLEVLNADYIKVAHAKGLRESVALYRHALRNALIPVITVMGIAFALLMSGTVIIENVFAIKGLGRVLIQGIINRDYPVVQGAILLVSTIFVFSNLLVDVLYTVIDPRIRYE